MPEFSIVIPVYNVEKYIDKCIKSLLKQTFDDFELIFVNDCSPDNSLKVIEKFAQNDSRIRIINQLQNGGTGKARNTGINAATGRYLCFVDPDDWVESNYLEEIHKAFKKDETLNSVMYKVWMYIEQQDFATLPLNYPSLSHHLEGYIEFNPTTLFMYPIWAWNKAYKLDFVNYNMIRFAESDFEELLFNTDFFLSSPRTYLIDKMLYFYRQRDNSWTYRSSTREDFEKIVSCLDVTETTYKIAEIKNFSDEYKESLLHFTRTVMNNYVNTKMEEFAFTEYEKLKQRLKN